MTYPARALRLEPPTALAYFDYTRAGEAPESEQTLAGVVLRLLLDDAWLADGLSRWDWDLLLRIGLSNRVLLRTAEALARRGIETPSSFGAAVASERRRVRAMLELAGQVTRVCQAHGVKFVVAKAFGHLPDLGTDLDVVLLAEPRRFHQVLVDELNATPRKERLDSWVAGRAVYTVAESGGPLDLHFGRLGQAGEHVTATHAIVARAQRAVVDGVEMVVPSPEDRLLLQVMHRMYGGYALRIADIVLGTRIVGMPELDWAYLTSMAKRDGILHGLAAYVHFVAEIHAEATGRSLDGLQQASELPRGPWGDISFRRGLFRFPALRLNATLYARALAHRVRTGDWRGALRLGLVPLVASAPLFRDPRRRARASLGARKTESPSAGARRLVPSTSVALSLFHELDREGVVYCHWKSNEHLAEGLRGETDVDILFAREDRATAEAVLGRLGFKRFQPTSLMAYPAIVDYIAFDPEQGRLVHCHTHFRLVAGEQHLKGHRLPWEHVLLARRVRDPDTGIFVTDPDAEMLLLLVRLTSKLRWRDGILAAVGRSYFRGAYRREYEWLRMRVNPAACEELCRTLLGEQAVPALRRLLEEPVTLRSLRRFRGAAKGTMGLFRSYGRLHGRLLRWTREIAWLVAVLNRSHLRVATPLRRTIPCGGVLVAFIGPDGSGKSTVTRAIATTFAAKLDVLLVYFGSGDGPSSLLRWPLILARRGLERVGLLRGAGAVRGGGPHGSAPTRRGRLLSTARVVWALVLSLEKRGRLRSAWRARNRGLVVVADRYPQAQVEGFNDGPLLSHLSAHRLTILRRLARWERAPYEWAERYPPDLVIKLVVSPEMALRRKPETGVDEVQRRVGVLRTLQWAPPTTTVEIDADQPAERVVGEAARAVWAHV